MRNLTLTTVALLFFSNLAHAAYFCSNNGLTCQWHDPKENYQAQPGEINMGASQPTVDTLTAAFPGYPAALAAQQAPTAPPIDAPTLAAILIQQGIIPANTIPPTVAALPALPIASPAQPAPAVSH